MSSNRFRIVDSLIEGCEKVDISDEEKGQQPTSFARYSLAATRTSVSQSYISELGKKLFKSPNGCLDLVTLGKVCVENQSHLSVVYKRSPSTRERQQYETICSNIKLCSLACESRGVLIPAAVMIDANSSNIFPADILPKILSLYNDSLGSTGNTNSILTFMLLVSYFERLLSEIVVFSLGDTATVRDVKITDVLQSDSLMSCLGSDVIMILRAMIGPLSGLQLRNMTWHNFVNSHEWEKPYTSLLLSILLSLSQSTGHLVPTAYSGVIPLQNLLRILRTSEGCQILLRKQYSDSIYKLTVSCNTEERYQLPKKRKRRKASRLMPIRHHTTSFLTSVDGSYVSPLEMADARARSHLGGPLLNFQLWHRLMSERFDIKLLPDFCISDFLTSVAEIIQTSPLILQSREKQWIEAVHFISTHQWYEAATLVTTLAESSLRLLYSAISHDNESWQCPESDELFLVLDDILGSIYFRECVPTGVLNILFDHWVWKEGVRIRDDIAHGSCHPNLLSEAAVVPIFLAIFQLCKENPLRCIRLETTPTEDKIEQFILQYECQLSPWNLFQREFSECVNSLNMFGQTCYLIDQRGDGFPVTQSGGTGDVFSLRNQRRDDDPNDLPSQSDIIFVINELRGWIPSFSKTSLDDEDVVNSVLEVINNLLTNVLKVDHPKISNITFIGKPSNCTNKRITELTVLRKIISSIKYFSSRIIDTYDCSYQHVMSRRAYAKQRIAYARLLKDFKSLFLMSTAAVVFVASNFFKSIPSDGELLRESCLNFVHSMLHQAELKQWYRCLPEYCNFVNLVNKQRQTNHLLRE